VALAIVGIAFGVINRKELPPTSERPGHAETFPSRQISAVPIPRAVQEHVMERNASHQAGRMLVQYNCGDYRCEAGLVDTLTEIVQSYPSTVYLAPYPGMDAMIALAAPGRLLTLDSLDEGEIQSFIQDNLDR
jgi:hypothetical protein